MTASFERLLKLCHLICAIAWMGTALGFLLALHVIMPENLEQAHVYSKIMRLLDDWVLVAGAYGILATGIIYGLWTNWGFFKYRWVAMKWILTILMVLLGTFGMGPLVEENSMISHAESFSRLLSNIDALKLLTVWQNLLLVIVLYLSVFKPVGKTHNKS